MLFLGASKIHVHLTIPTLVQIFGISDQDHNSSLPPLGFGLHCYQQSLGKIVVETAWVSESDRDLCLNLGFATQLGCLSHVNFSMVYFWIYKIKIILISDYSSGVQMG